MNTASPNRARFGVLIKLTLLAAVLVAASRAGTWVIGELDFFLTPGKEPYVHRAIMTVVVVYVLLMTLPFVPGIELGLVLMVMFGAKIVPLVYLATILALLLAFLMGRFVPHQFVLELLAALRLRRAQKLLTRIEPLTSDERLEFLLQRASTRWVPFLLKHRHLAIAVALNLPGNAIIGGGGGIGLAAGFSRLISLPAYVLTVSLAIAPLPLMVWLTGG